MQPEVIAELKNLFSPDHVRDHCPLAPYTTYRLGGTGELVLFPHSSEELAHMIGRLNWHDEQVELILGHGANVLIADAGIPRVTIVLRYMNAVHFEGDSLIADAGLAADTAAEVARIADRTGLEFLAGLPGTIGGATFMNARAFDHDVAGVLEWVELIEPDGKVKTYYANPADFGYKRSPFMDLPSIVSRVSLRVWNGDGESIAAAMDRHRAMRRARGEDRVLSCGCVFQNPTTREAPAGKLIDGCGLKGFGTEHAWVYASHANFMIHDGAASAAELRALFLEVQRIVAEQTGVVLQPEVRFCGEFPDDDVFTFRHDPARANQERT
ncbi:MAG: UDP-N-acetylenolpyruvoylglucosamine reductase [Deltaproteobacteria bacterium HGW-Deltaproteobacteria-22]|jgi:UDP-N-acetylmuramate dehydrogenase|nr:MAG: UDP-N-acetylenolpyruvoylglucosamine reductase [Deltaproteobacteria bacterium HGW-Deltaproteobacteria-22]